jgi:hypothetical protein
MANPLVVGGVLLQPFTSGIAADAATTIMRSAIGFWQPAHCDCGYRLP